MATFLVALVAMWITSILSFRIPFLMTQLPSRARVRTRLKQSLVLSATKPTKFYNSMTKKKEEFYSMLPDKVSFYSCGPTVHDFCHIGNIRTFLFYDLLKRWLLYCGYDVDHVCNLTDIDEKILLKMRNFNMTLEDVATRHANSFLEDMENLNILKPKVTPRVTQHMQQIIEFVEILVRSEFAYVSNGSVYFNVSKLEKPGAVGYGRLQSRNLPELVPSNGDDGKSRLSSFTSFLRSQQHRADKFDKRDFVLWKAVGNCSHGNPNDPFLNVCWNSPFGLGRPGWHVECSAICRHYLGDSIDIHAGGLDLIFPHHENELAQSEAATGKPFVRYWMHSGLVVVNGTKMSKSKGNFIQLRELCNSSVEYRAFRALILTHKYRSTMDFDEAKLGDMILFVSRLDNIYNDLRRVALESPSSIQFVSATATGFDANSSELNVSSIAAICFAEFESAMADDLNSPVALTSLWRLVNSSADLLQEGKKYVALFDEQTISPNSLVFRQVGVQQADTLELLKVLKAMDSVLGVLPADSQLDTFIEENPSNPSILSEEVKSLVYRRILARKQKQFSQSDFIRETLLRMGFRTRDSPGRIELYPAST